jgi:hypothetical protein
MTMGKKKYPPDPRYYLPPSPLVLTGGNREKIIAALISRDGPECRYCRKVLTIVSITIEHLQPKSRGGNNRINNLAISCAPCNNRKGPMTDEEFFSYLKGEFIDSCRYCGVDLSGSQALYCGDKHGKRFNNARYRTPIFAQTLTQSTPETRQAVYEVFSSTSPKPPKETT